MPPSAPRFQNVLVMTPDNCARYQLTRALRRRCDNLFELNFIETFKNLGIIETQNLISRIIAEKKIDVFFISFNGDSYLLPLEFLFALKKMTRIVLACFDDETAFDTHSKYYAAAADAVMTTDSFSVSAYRKLGIPAVLFLVSFPKELYPALNLTRDIDVSFVGHCRKTDRKEYMDFLEANGIGVQRFGFGSQNGFITDSEMSRVFCRSKINLSFSRLEYTDWIHGENPGVTRAMGYKSRPIEIAMTGSFCLSEYFPALPRVFEIGKEIDCFTDRRSLLEKVRHHLSHEDERERIAARAHERALREYEDGPYFAKIMEELTAIFSGASSEGLPRPVFHKNREFKKRHINDLVLHALSLMLHCRLRACIELIPGLFQYGSGIFLAGAAGGVMRGFDILRRKLRDSDL